ncbi:transcriptional regulator with XRE-family HTH domain [Desulfohalotomaculum tongense]|uniref:helix-turn-helix domain-containing protein n=1 Tax=Desulforadius tongensis TaxID=1216062 RepID=UPI0019589836|nr:helix-turn-helix transcriptional regulator [Desulforadius tongensis]MBM7854098.1 transcriptional regulator with XRE-family HTH domain [Desulforadius tongensis]
MSIPKRIKELRARAGISQETLAQKLGVSVASVASYEIGRVNPSIEVLKKIADIFGVSVDYILGRSNDEPIVPIEISFMIKSLPEKKKEKVIRYLQFIVEEEMNY